MVFRRFLICAVIIMIISLLQFAAIRAHAGTETQIPLVTMSLERVPMQDALKRLSQIVGYEITVSSHWANSYVSIVLKRCRMEDALAKILKGAGSPNHVVIIDNEKKKIEVLIADSASLGNDGSKGETFSNESEGIDTGSKEVEAVDGQDFKKFRKSAKPLDEEQIPEEIVEETEPEGEST